MRVPPPLLAALAALLTAAACDCEAEAIDPAACQARVGLFTERMTDVGRGSYAWPTEVTLPRIDGGEVMHRDRPRVTIHVDHVSSGGSAATEGELLDDLDTMTRNWSLLHPGVPVAPPPLVLADARAEISTRRELLRRVAERRPFQLAVRGPEMPDPLPYEQSSAALRSQVEQFRSTKDGSERAALLSEMWTDALSVLPTCAPAVRGFGDVSWLVSEERNERMRGTMAAAFESCSCRGVDIDAIETAMALTSLKQDREQRMLATFLSPATDATPIALPPDATFEELARAVAARDDSVVWFQLGED